MATPPRRWPDRAEAYRLDAIACLLDIQDWAAEVDDLIARGRNREALYLIASIRKQAAKAQGFLQAARDVKPQQDTPDVLEQTEQLLAEHDEQPARKRKQD